jgi:SPP1 gp7 family putative phage head morphogenesis protein
LFELYDEGVVAIDYILKDALHYEVRKALDPLNAHHFEILTKSIAQSLKGHVIPVEDGALKKAMNVLDAKWTEMTPAARGKLLGVASSYLGAPVAHAVMPKIEQTLKFAGKDLVEDTKKSSIHTYDLKISPSLTAHDDLTLSSLITSNGNYIRDQYGKRSEAFSLKAKGVVANGISKGLGSSDITEDLVKELGDAQRGRGYWDMIAMVFANRARTTTQLLSYHEAGITSYLWESVLDEATSDQCRFMHGRRFSMKKAVASIDKVDALKNPEEIEQIQPFLSVGNHPDGGKGIYYDRGNGGGRAFVTQITSSAVGFKDDTGSYSHMGTDESLEDQGLHMPPIHGRCRSTVIPTESATSPGGAPPEPVEEPAAPPPPPKLSGGAKKAAALAQLADVNQGGEVDSSKFFANHSDEIDYLDHPIFSVNSKANWEANKVSKKPNIDDLTSTTPSFDADKVETYIKKPTALDKAKKPQVVKFKGQFLILSGHEQIAAQKLMGQKKAYVDFVDLDKPTKSGLVVSPVEPEPPETSLAHVITPVEPEPPAPPPPLAPALVHTNPRAADPEYLRAEGVNILGEKTGDARGSNKGGFYTGKDGVARYVKFYEDHSQAWSEHLANSIYADLGHAAPESTVFEHDGKIGYASEIVAGKTLKEAMKGTAAETVKYAKKIMSGFAADVLVGNWDVVGLDYDNVMVTNAGQVLRIDNGGSFLMRAKAGRKPPGVLNDITEWDKFIDAGVNPSYSTVAGFAGVHAAGEFTDEMKKQVIAEIGKIMALRDAHGGWKGYVENVAPGIPWADKNLIVTMLESRTNRLEIKAEELKRPAPADREQPIIGHLPVKKLPPGRMPMPLPEGHTDSYKWDEIARSRFRGAPGQDGVTVFTGNTYGMIRAHEQGHEKFEGSSITSSAKKAASDIEKFFKAAKPSPGTTVYRGIHNKKLYENGREIETLSNEKMQALLDREFVEMSATSSTSWSPSTAFSFGNIDESSGGYDSKMNRVLFVMKQKSGVCVKPISRSDSENEFLLKQGTTFKITDRYRIPNQKNVLVIECEEVPKKQPEPKTWKRYDATGTRGEEGLQ